jgi:hypothetical protein
MSPIEDAADVSPSADQGPLARVIATRGGKASPEAPLVIEHREALIYMLCQAAELEHGIMCQYLFAAFSLKQRGDEGLSGDELEAVARWRKLILHVATQEMLHLALVHNLLSAIGAAPRSGLGAPGRTSRRGGCVLRADPLQMARLKSGMSSTRSAPPSLRWSRTSKLTSPTGGHGPARISSPCHPPRSKPTPQTSRRCAAEPNNSTAMPAPPPRQATSGRCSTGRGGSR